MPATATSYRPHVGVHLILTANGKVLLLRRASTGFADGSWSLPGGCLDEGETLPAAAAREALEEVGITINPADLAFAHLCHHADPDGASGVLHEEVIRIYESEGLSYGQIAKRLGISKTLAHQIITARDLDRI
jgi:8-oxo-dGTP pyrophosphatase MutT (NUDIX family)